MDSFEIPVFSKKKKPNINQSVSNIFATAQKNIEEKEEKKKREIGEKMAEKILKKKRKEQDPKPPPPESPFLKLLKDRMNNIPQKAPVPTPSNDSQSNEPVIGFGEKMLKKQGYEEPKKKEEKRHTPKNQ